MFISVDVLLKPAGDAPIMKKKKWAVDRNKKVSYISDFIKRFIKMQPSESLVSCLVSPLPDMPILGSSNSAANKDMMSKIWTKWGYSYLIE